MKFLKTFFSFITILLLFYSCNEADKNITLRYSYAEDGMLLINGNRKFIIGSYHHPKTDNPFKELRKNGYNYVHVSPNKALLDSANINNLRTWITTGTVSNNDESDTLRIIQLIKQYMGHPSLLCWEIADEPAFNWNNSEPRITHEKMLETFSLIRSIDTEHLVFTNHGPVNLISTLQKYNSSTDIVGVDVYPVIPQGITPTYALYPDGLQGDLLNPYISQVGEYIDKMKKVVNNSKPIFAVLQGFSWEMLKPKEERDISMIQYPTYEESRFMAFNAIVHGANGILYWGTNYTPQPSGFMDDLNRVTRELAEYQHILSSPNYDLNIKKEYHELRYSVDSGIEFIGKKVNSKTYLITVNSDKNPVKVSLMGLMNFKTAVVLKEERSIKIIENKLTDYYKPFDVHVYELIK